MDFYCSASRWRWHRRPSVPLPCLRFPLGHWHANFGASSIMLSNFTNYTDQRPFSVRQHEFRENLNPLPPLSVQSQAANILSPGLLVSPLPSSHQHVFISPPKIPQFSGRSRKGAVANKCLAPINLDVFDGFLAHVRQLWRLCGIRRMRSGPPIGVRWNVFGIPD